MPEADREEGGDPLIDLDLVPLVRIEESLRALEAEGGSESALALVVAIVAINLVGDRLRDVLNPRLSK